MTAPSRFEFDFLITERNFLDTFELANPRYRMIILAAALIAVASGALLIALGEYTVGVGALAGGLAFGVLSSRMVMLWRVRRAAKSTIGTTGHAVIDESGVEITHSVGSARLNWSGLGEVRTTERTMTFMRGKVLWGWVGLDGLDHQTRDRLIAFAHSQIASRQ